MMHPSPREQSAWACRCEKRPWNPSSTHGRRLRDLIRSDYEAAVPPAIAELPVELDADAALDASEAAAAIVRFDAEIGAGFAPFTSLLLRSESSASSQIEQITAGSKALLMADAGDTSGRNATLVAGNVAAMRTAIALADDPNEQAILDMHRALLEDSNPEIVGKWRTEQVWIGGRNVSPHEALFVPPHHDHVPDAMADLVAFMRRTDVEPFTQAMIAHAQFETIHPFPDGNGRTGRALIHAHLRHAGLARHVTVPISAGLLAATDRYFEALGAYRRGELSPIVSLAADATHAAVANGRQLASDIDDIRTRWTEAASHIRSDAVAHRVIRDLPAEPVIDATTVQDRYEVSSPAASRAIRQLLDADILTQANAGLRFRKYIAVDIADALDAFAQRSGRRQA